MTRDRLAVLLVALVALSASAAVAAPAGASDAAEASGDTPDVTLTVTVTDNFNNPIQDATVVASWDGGETTGTTVSNGKTFVDVPEGATVEITVKHGAYVRNNPVVVEDASEQEVQVKVFRKAEASVTVTDQDGEPIADAKVTLFKRGNVAASGRTDGQGVFDSGTIEKGDYHVVAVKSGFFTNETDVRVQDSTDLSLGLRQGTVTVQFEVTDDHFSPAKPIEGADIQIQNVGTLKTTSDGTQTAAVPVNSDVEISVTKDGYETTTRTIRIGESSRDVSFTINRENALTLEPDNQQIVAGTKVRLTVTDEYGDTVEGATILVDGEEVGTTGADGTFQATLDSAGTHDIVAKHEGVTSSTVTVEAIEPGGEDTATATTKPDTETPSATETGTSTLPVPGFGVGAALLALLGTVAVLRRQR